MTLLKVYNFIERVFVRILNVTNLKINNVSYSKDFTINGRVFIRNHGAIIIGKNFGANSGSKFNPIGGDTILRLVTQNSVSRICIGDNVGISNSTLYCWNNIILEDNVIIGGGVRIWDSNFHSLNSIIRMSGSDFDIKSAPIRICKQAFIGGGSIILKGVTIGENSIIAAGSVVNKSIPPNVIAGGNPCKVIKKLEFI